MTVAYNAKREQFASDRYWRQSIVRPTGELPPGPASSRRRVGCSAIEERPMVPIRGHWRPARRIHSDTLSSE